VKFILVRKCIHPYDPDLVVDNLYAASAARSFSATITSSPSLRL
jgi:hypothetical protein